MGWIPGSTPTPGSGGHAMIGGPWWPWPKPTPTAAKRKRERGLRGRGKTKGISSRGSEGKSEGMKAKIRHVGTLVGGAY
jgi:hypothetical protein